MNKYSFFEQKNFPNWLFNSLIMRFKAKLRFNEAQLIWIYRINKVIIYT